VNYGCIGHVMGNGIIVFIPPSVESAEQVIINTVADLGAEKCRKGDKHN
jgi:hypothetical protein